MEPWMDLDFTSPQFWIAVGQIIMIDILLGGDNAVVIALACRRLDPKRRRLGILWGTAGAIGLRVILVFFALTLLAIPYLKVVGALLLFWIGVKLLLPEEDHGHANIEGSDKLWAAVRTVIVADLVMSIDNVIAIAGAAQGAGDGHQMPLVIFGLLVSVPIIIWGSTLVLKLIDRFPAVVTFGAGLLGWIAGGMFITDVFIVERFGAPETAIKLAAEIAGAAIVILAGRVLLATRRRKAASEAAVEQSQEG